MGNQGQHWESVYRQKQPHQMSWTQSRPETSLRFIARTGLPLSASIIDIGGGDSQLADCLLTLGYRDITVLDISAAAIGQAQKRLGDRAGLVRWLVADIREFEADRHYDLWHDRATFHFLTEPEEVEGYVAKAAGAVSGYMTIGTFSQRGPERCSGLPVRQYTDEHLTTTLSAAFEKLECSYEDHVTPFDTVQNFLFCNFAKSA